jgi:hypothetical protein
LVPLTIALTPSFANLSTAVNNDVGAMIVFSLFLLTASLLILRGFSWPVAVALLIIVFAALFTKTTVMVAVPLALVVLLFALTHLKGIWFIYLGALLAIFFASVGWREAANWIRLTNQPGTVRNASHLSPFGAHAFCLKSSPENVDPRLIQLMPQSQVHALRGETITLGAWMWSDQPMQSRTPMLVVDGEENYYEVSLTSQPTFLAFNTKVDPYAQIIQIILYPIPQYKHPGGILTVCLDGIVLAEGKYPTRQTPIFSDSSLVNGIWGENAFTNLIRNPSAEKTWPWVLPWVDRIMFQFLSIWPSLFLYLFLEPSTISWYIDITSKNLFQTFWAKFGWGHIPLVGGFSYITLFIITVIGIIGAFLSLLTHRKRINYPITGFLGLSLALVWTLTFLRGLPTIVRTVFIPSSRYASPVMLLSMIILVGGWHELFRFGKRLVSSFNSKQENQPSQVVETEVSKFTFSKAGIILYAAFFSWLNILAIYSIIFYYY